MDQSEAKIYNLDFQDVVALEQSGVNIRSLKNFIQGILKVYQEASEAELRTDYEQKIHQLQNEISHMHVVTNPLRELTHGGKGLKEGLIDYVMSSDGIMHIIDKTKHEIIQSKQMHIEFVSQQKLRNYEMEVN